VSSDPQALPSSELVASKYRLTRLIGRGGMGSVWEGIHVTLGNRVAVKFIETDYADNDEARTRFENEARAAARLQSKHVVGVFDYGVMPDGRPFIVMEYLSGESLDARLERSGPMTVEQTVVIITQVSRALSKAHAAGIVHRDLKPENVFLVHDDEDGTDIAKVVDFGIAKFTDTSMGVSSSTRTGSVLGTPYYMSPEQARGLRSLDFRSDLWSLAVITYRCLTGRFPFEGEAIGDLLVKICTAALPVPSQVAPTPPGFDAWFEKAMQRDPALRFASATEFADQLASSCGLGAVRPRLPSAPQGLPASGQVNVLTATRGAKDQTGIPLSRTLGNTLSHRRSGLAIAAIAAAIFLIGSAGGVWWLVSRKAETEHAASAAPPTASSEIVVTPPGASVLPSVSPTPTASVLAIPAIASVPVAEPAASAVAPAKPANEPTRAPNNRPGAAANRQTQPPHTTASPPPANPVNPRPPRNAPADLGY
jgi:eukaryotic-like serine/threonine-protein kinase